MDLERWAAVVATVALATGCGSGKTTVGTSSVPDPGGSAVDSGSGGGGGDGGVVAGGSTDGGTTGADGGATSGGDGGAPGLPPCSSTPVAVGTSLEPMATDDSWIYGWGPQQIARVPIGGGPAQTVVGAIDTTVDFAMIVDDRYVYWTTATQISNNLFRASKSGGDQPLLLSDAGRELIADADYVYSLVDWRGNGNGIVRIRKADGSRLDAQVGGGGMLAAVDDRFVYWVTYGGSVGYARLARFPKTLYGNVEIYGSWQLYDDFGALPPRVAFDSRSLFAWDFGRIVRVDLADGAATTIDARDGDRPGALAVDGDTIYSASDVTYDDAGPPPYPIHFIHRVNRDGSAPGTLVADTTRGHRVVVAGDSIYFDEGTTLYRQCKR